RDGHAYRLERLLDGSCFLEALRLSQPQWPNLDTSVPLLEGIHCRCDSRRYIPAVTHSDNGYMAFAYWTKSLSARLDLLKDNWGAGDELVIRVHPVAVGAIGARDVPTVVVQTNCAPMLILWPELLCAGDPGTGEAPVFGALAEQRAAQALVTVE